LADKENVMMDDNSYGAAGVATANRRKADRLLCSDLITVHWGTGRGSGRQEAAVLEDYAPTGASLSIEFRIEPGTPVTLRTQWESFGAVVKRCEWRDHGYLLGVEFDKPRLDDGGFVPDHLVDPSELGI
jgi:hypothetical protein